MPFTKTENARKRYLEVLVDLVHEAEAGVDGTSEKRYHDSDHGRGPEIERAEALAAAQAALAAARW